MAGLFFENYIEEGNERNISHEMFSDVPKENLFKQQDAEASCEAKKVKV